jgi:hypothetical protein
MGLKKQRRDQSTLLNYAKGLLSENKKGNPEKDCLNLS